MQTDKLFTGQREMAGLGIYDYGARFYSPKLGRFLSPDTIVPGYANPQALNRYPYVLNMPIIATDPTGHKCVSEGAGDCQTPSGTQINGTGSVVNLKKFPTIPKIVKHKGTSTRTSTPVRTEKNPYSYVSGLGSSPVDIYVSGVGSNGFDIYVLGPNGLGLETFDPVPNLDKILLAKSKDKNGDDFWTTGRKPKNDKEKDAIGKIKKDPANGKQIIPKLGDPRWPPEEGWVKMERKINGQTYHWNYNKFTGEAEDIKPVP